MGLVNLSILVEKLKKKLSGEYIKKTDYATASKFGVVKVGNNINVNSGKISVPVASDTTAGVVKVGTNLSINDGVLSASSGGTDLLWEEDTENPTACTGGQGVTLSHSSADYNILLVINRRDDSSLYMPMILHGKVQNIIQATAGINASGYTSVIVYNANGTSLTLASDMNIGGKWHKVIGIK